MSNPKAQAAKEKGNQAFKAADYPSAIGHYTSAILADKSDPAFYLNRAAAYLKLGKFEDAERDCTTVLSLPKHTNNVKALFRRGQARVGLGRPLEAEQDFSAVLRIEPNNTSAQDELKNVTSLIQKEKAKKAKAPLSPVQSSLSPSTTTGPGQRRRVPIRVVDGDGKPVSVPVPASVPASSPSMPVSSSSATAGATKKKAAPPPAEPMDVDTDAEGTVPSQPQAQPPTPRAKPSPSAPETLEPVSSRSLKTSSPSSSPATASKPSAPAPPTSAPPAPSPSAPAPSSKPTPAPAPSSKPAQPQSFKQAKQARQSRTAGAPTVAVGGGIFKKNGESVLFPSRGGGSGGVGAGGQGADTAQGAAGAGAGQAGEEAMDVDVDAKGKAGTAASVTTTPNPTPGVPTQPFASLNLNLDINGTQSEVAKAPSTLFEFTRLWESVSVSNKEGEEPERMRGLEERWRLINTILPSQFPALCKTSLEPALLVAIFEVFLAVLRSLSASSAPQAQEIKQRVREYLDAFTLIPRFSTLLLFLSKREKEVARDVWALLDVDNEGLKQSTWKAVAV